MYLPAAASASAMPGQPTTTLTTPDGLASFFLEGMKKPGAPPGGWSSLIGIVTAICGNILISFALNTQRYAHIRLSRERTHAREVARRAERRAHRNEGLSGYGTQGGGRTDPGLKYDGAAEREEEEERETDALLPPSPQSSLSSEETVRPNEKDHDDEGHTSYLRSPIWWLGIGLMIIGEAGNFLAYGFAPASIVSPMGVVALVSNCLIAPLLLGEKFRWRDAVGVIIAVAGCVTVVLSANDSNPKLTPESIWHLITRWEFETYFGITVLLIIILSVASDRFGDRSIMIDIGLVGLYGGYTALSTKGIASLLSNTIWRVVTFPITYLLLVVLVFTAVMQIKYINRALQRFNATMVIPTQFVTFTLSVIIGSAVLYRDFERQNTEDAIKFIGGCALTFLGVWCITSGRGDDHSDDNEESGEDEDGIYLDEEEHSEVRHADFDGERRRSAASNRPPAHRRHRTEDSIPPTVLVTPDLSARQGEYPPHFILDESPSRKPKEDLRPATQASIHTDTLAPLPPSNSNPRHPPMHATTSSPVVPTQSDFGPSLRPTTPNHTRNTSVPSTRSPNLGAGNPQTPASTSYLDPNVLLSGNNRLHPRSSMNTLFPGPLTSPLSSSLSAIVADSLRRGVDSNNGSSLKRRRSSKAGTMPQRRRTGTLPSTNSAGEAGSQSAIRPTTAPGGDSEDYPDPESPSADKRVRSLSGTLGDLFSGGGSSRELRRGQTE